MLQGIRFAIVITSDRAAQGIREDLTGPLLIELIEKRGGTCQTPLILSDDKRILREKIEFLSRDNDIDVILTSGGTGLGHRDITVDVTKELIEREIPGFGEEMRRRSMEVTPYGILSRATAGTMNDKLILNLPGNPQGAVDCLGWVLQAMSHVVRMLKKIDLECPKIQNLSGKETD